MKAIIWIVLLSLVFLSGCSGTGFKTNSLSAPGNPAQPQPATGPADNWKFVASSTGRRMGMALQFSQTSVGGEIRILGDASNCFTELDSSRLTGNIDANGNAVMTAPLEDGTLTLNGVFDAARTNFSGTYSVKNVCDNGENGTITGIKMPPVTGTYAGVINSLVSSETLSITLTQQADLALGLHATGKISITSPTCTAVFDIIDSRLAGDHISLFFQPAANETDALSGLVSDDATTLSLADYDGTCGGGGYGVLVRQ